MTTSEPKSPRLNHLDEASAEAPVRGGRAFLPGVYRLQFARTLLKALSGKRLLDSAASGSSRASEVQVPTVPPDSK